MASLVQELDDAPNVLTWLNNTLTPQDNHLSLVALESLLPDLLTATELSAATTSAALERTIDEVSRSAPRLTYDLHFMRDGALSLHSALAGVIARIPAETDTSAALDKLQTLDAEKRKMEAARDVLREAESWSSLEAEVTALLAERAYDKAAGRLNEASRSMSVFAGTPEYEPRRALMVSLQNQLEAALSSALVGAINSGDTALCRKFYAIFANIQRESEFRNYYFGSRRAALLASWQSEALEDTEPSVPAAPKQTFSAFWTTFCASFLAVLSAERMSIPSIFPDPQITLSTFITSTLSTLQPSCSQRLALLFSAAGSSALKDVITIYKATEEFAASTDKIMEKIQFSAIPTDNALDSPTLPKPTRRRSMRISMSWRSNSAVSSSRTQHAMLDDALDWDQTLFQAFLDFQVDYSTLEQRLLSDELSFASTLPDKNPNMDHARLLRERAVDVFGIAEESIVRCISFTYGYAAPELVLALDSSLASFVDFWTQFLPANLSAHSGAQAESEYDLADLDYSPQDWSNIQLALHLLASTRSVLERLGTFEGKLRAALVQVATAFRLAQHGDEGLYTPGATKGAGLLLAQSPLNSAALHALLSSTESHPSAPLLTATRTSIASLARALQSSLQNTLLAPLHAHLSSYASLPLWAAPGDPKSMCTAGDLHVPVFSLSPTDTVQRVTEGLLNLPRLFEVYADDDALGFSLNTLPDVDEAYLSGGGLGEQQQQQIMMHVQSPELGGRNQNRRASLVLPPKPPQALSAEAVEAAWLSSLGRSILSHLTTNILPKIRTLSVAGAAQLSSDLGYMSNIVRALNVEYEELDRWKECAEMNDEEGKRAIAGKISGDQVLVSVARMRGWA